MEHANFIRDKFVEVFTEKGVKEKQVKAAIAVLDARAKIVIPENPDAYYRRIKDIGKGEFQSNNVLFQFIGENSKFKKANEKLDEAKSLHKDGVDIEDIFKQTGWYIDRHDGKWRYELPQDKIKFKNFIAGEFSNTLENILDYPELFESYPELRETNVSFVDGLTEKEGGRVNQATKEIEINANDNHKRQESVLRHEIQHLIQLKEGFAIGTSPGTGGVQQVAKRVKQNRSRIGEIESLLRTLPKDAPHFNLLTTERESLQEENDSYAIDPEGAHIYFYGSYAGEMEANNVEERIKESERAKGSPRLTGPKYRAEDITLQFQGEKGALETLVDGTFVIHILESPDFSTAIHELGHIFETELSEEQRQVVKDFAKTHEWNRETSEIFATAFEKYLEEGKAPCEALKSIFEQAKQWLTDIYSVLRSDVILSPELRIVFNELLAVKPKFVY